MSLNFVSHVLHPFHSLDKLMLIIFLSEDKHYLIKEDL